MYIILIKRLVQNEVDIKLLVVGRGLWEAYNCLMEKVIINLVTYYCEIVKYFDLDINKWFKNSSKIDYLKMENCDVKIWAVIFNANDSNNSC